jgi:hypothetical protein
MKGMPRILKTLNGVLAAITGLISITPDGQSMHGVTRGIGRLGLVMAGSRIHGMTNRTIPHGRTTRIGGGIHRSSHTGIPRIIHIRITGAIHITMEPDGRAMMNLRLAGHPVREGRVKKSEEAVLHLGPCRPQEEWGRFQPEEHELLELPAVSQLRQAAERVVPK